MSIDLIREQEAGAGGRRQEQEAGGRRAIGHFPFSISHLPAGPCRFLLARLSLRAPTNGKWKMTNGK